MKKDALNLKIIYFAILAGQMLFLGVLFFVIKPPYEPQTILRILGPLIALGLIIIGFYVYRLPLKKLDHLRQIEEQNILDNEALPLPEEEIKKLFGTYRASSLVRMCMVEFANLMLLAFYYMSGDHLLIFYFTLGLVVFGTTAPSIRQFARDYELTLVEERALQRD
ncbi:MAG: hypothetical protein AAF502_14040 [Bacteroidota bacterium]